jgi:hypothetical protein
MNKVYIYVKKALVIVIHGYHLEIKPTTPP